MTVLFALLGLQVGSIPEPTAFGDRSFLAQVVEARKDLAAGRFDAAAARFARYPGRRMNVRLDLEGGTEAQRNQVRLALRLVTEDWRRFARPVQLVVAPGRPDLVVSWTDALPERDGRRPGAVMFRSASPTDPAVEVVVARIRGEDGRPSVPGDYRRDIIRAIGAAYGLAETPLTAGIMGPSDASTDFRGTIDPFSAQAIVRNQDLVEAIRNAAAARRPIPYAGPGRISVDVRRLDLGAVPQGRVVRQSIQVVNTGDSPVQIRPLSDCICLRLPGAETIKPGGIHILRFEVDTTPLQGGFQRTIELMNADPDLDPVTVTVQGEAVPAYRWIPDRQGIIRAGSGPTAWTGTLRIERPDLKVTEFALAGVAGRPEVESSPIEGGGAAHRLKFTLPPMPLGVRRSFGIEAKSVDPVFPAIRFSASVQRGLAVLPP
ncbi:MAG: DUF1573 domain-containing protein, partial [Fimbriimonadaceae bacterium]|nr:DUF1573 domain-containing protein [Fimbriimonadaceae bacterium]